MSNTPASPGRASSYHFHAPTYPEHPGCYLMRGEGDRILYVGKAINLRRRLASYFRNSKTRHRKAEMIERIREIEVILVRNDREALVLESNLIRALDPPYNSRFTREEDSYYYIALTDESFPRFVPYRKRRTNFALQAENCELDELFGPYVGWRLRNRMLDALRTQFALRTCHSLPTEPCIRADAALCLAPCRGALDQERYLEVVRQAARFLRRPPKTQLDRWTREMKAAAASLDFEGARKRRDWIAAFAHARQKQVVERSDPRNLAIVYWAQGRALWLSVQSGNLVGVKGPTPVSPSSVGCLPFLQTVQAETEAYRIVMNQSPCDQDLLDGLKVYVPQTPSTATGQLLEIAQLNHTYRTNLSAASVA